jgi:hypothetical protein
VSPIFVRPVREQLEHDRLIRFLQAKYKRKGEIGLNVGDEQAHPVKLGAATFFPDIMLTDGKKLTGLVEVETGESVNNLEAMAQWVHFAKARVPFHLYVPVQSFEVARRLCQAYGAKVSELWTYRPTHDGFDLVRMAHDPTAPGAAVVAAAAAAAAAGKAGGRKPAVKPPATKKAPAAKKAAAKKPAKAPAKKAPARKPAVKAKAAPKARKAARKR